MSTVSIGKYNELLEKYNKLESDFILITQHYEWLKRQMFGSKSERFVNPDDQQELDLGVESVEIEINKEHVEYDRTTLKTKSEKSGHSRGEMPTHLPFVDEIITPENEDLTGCRKIGQEVTWEIDYEPGKCFVRRFIRPKYIRPKDNRFIIAALPQRPIDRGNFGPGIMSSITTDKYLYHTPLYRQSQKIFRESNLKIAESTLCDIIRHTFTWLDPVFDTMRINFFANLTYMMADETPIPVLSKTKKGKTHKGFYWVYHDPVRKIVLFNYCKTRGSDGPSGFLKDYKNGILQIDGYAGYNKVIESNNLTRAACMAHVRRKFEDAIKYNKDVASSVLVKIGIWFDVERKAKDLGLNYQERHALRIENDLPKKFAEFKSWMIAYCVDALPTDAVRRACEYALGQWDGFQSFLEDGRVELTNNLIENCIRPVTLGRKNFMFKGSDEAAQRGAVIYSIIATAKLHGLDPREYIKFLLQKLPSEFAKNIEKYLPWAIEIVEALVKKAA